MLKVLIKQLKNISKNRMMSQWNKSWALRVYIIYRINVAGYILKMCGFLHVTIVWFIRGGWLRNDIADVALPIKPHSCDCSAVVWCGSLNPVFNKGTVDMVLQKFFERSVAVEFCKCDCRIVCSHNQSDYIDFEPFLRFSYRCNVHH